MKVGSRRRPVSIESGLPRPGMQKEPTAVSQTYQTVTRTAKEPAAIIEQLCNTNRQTMLTIVSMGQSASQARSSSLVADTRGYEKRRNVRWRHRGCRDCRPVGPAHPKGEGPGPNSWSGSPAAECGKGQNGHRKNERSHLPALELCLVPGLRPQNMYVPRLVDVTMSSAPSLFRSITSNVEPIPERL